MRKFIISLAVAGSALAFATPAAAQYFPAPQGNAYGYNNYGYNSQRVHQLNRRIERLNTQIQRLGRARVISQREAHSLANEARAIAYRLHETSRNGLNPREERAVEVRLARLEQRIGSEARDGNRWGNRDGRWDDNNGRRDNGYSQMGPDRDRDGLDDRYEDDRGTRHD